ncbi:MAG: response regulator [Desulfurivibrionaceae bacterium]|nr:response regulator [Desulfurivibrionaceae bacterium]
MAYQALNFQDAAASLIQESQQLLLILEKKPAGQKSLSKGAESLRTLRGVANLFTLDNITRVTALAAHGLDTAARCDQEADPRLIRACLALLDNVQQTGSRDMEGRVTHNLTATLAPFVTTSPRERAPKPIAADTKILIIDDEVLNLALLEEFIKTFNKNIQITAVDSVAEALFYYFSEEFDLVFLDIMMPVVDGNHFLAIIEKNRAARHIFGDANIVVQTAVQSVGELLPLVRKECVLEVIRKPLLRKRIYTCIERYCPAFHAPFAGLPFQPSTAGSSS